MRVMLFMCQNLEQLVSCELERTHNNGQLPVMSFTRLYTLSEQFGLDLNKEELGQVCVSGTGYRHSGIGQKHTAEKFLMFNFDNFFTRQSSGNVKVTL